MIVNDAATFASLSQNSSMSTTELHPPDTHFLLAARGWLELGNASEAADEIARISAEGLNHPDVLHVRWAICAATQNWEAALPLAEHLVAIAPDRPDGWIHRAYSMRRVKSGGLQKAWDALLPAAELFPNESMIPYNLACYAARFSRPEEAWEWLHKAIKAAGDVGAIKRTALADDDLEPLWPRIREL
jgi:tetratricopeptide (TPR) repeat protein